MGVINCSIERVHNPGRRGINEVLFGGAGGIGFFSDESGFLVSEDPFWKGTRGKYKETNKRGKIYLCEGYRLNISCLTNASTSIHST